MPRRRRPATPEEQTPEPKTPPRSPEPRTPPPTSAARPPQSDLMRRLSAAVNRGASSEGTRRKKAPLVHVTLPPGESPTRRGIRDHLQKEGIESVPLGSHQVANVASPSRAVTPRGKNKRDRVVRASVKLPGQPKHVVHALGHVLKENPSLPVEKIITTDLATFTQGAEHFLQQAVRGYIYSQQGRRSPVGGKHPCQIIRPLRNLSGWPLNGTIVSRFYAEPDELPEDRERKISQDGLMGLTAETYMKDVIGIPLAGAQWGHKIAFGLKGQSAQSPENLIVQSTTANQCFSAIEQALIKYVASGYDAEIEIESDLMKIKDGQGVVLAYLQKVAIEQRYRIKLNRAVLTFTVNPLATNQVSFYHCQKICQQILAYAHHPDLLRTQQSRLGDFFQQPAAAAAPVQAPLPVVVPRQLNEFLVGDSEEEDVLARPLQKMKAEGVDVSFTSAGVGDKKGITLPLAQPAIAAPVSTAEILQQFSPAAVRPRLSLEGFRFVSRKQEDEKVSTTPASSAAPLQPLPLEQQFGYVSRKPGSRKRLTSEDRGPNEEYAVQGSDRALKRSRNIPENSRRLYQGEGKAAALLQMPAVPPPVPPLVGQVPRNLFRTQQAPSGSSDGQTVSTTTPTTDAACNLAHHGKGWWG